MTTWDDVADRTTFTMPVAVDELQRLVPAHARVIELGCGYGRVVSMLHRVGFTKVVGYDVSPRMIEIGRERDASLDLRLMDFTSIPEPDASVDAVVLCALMTSLTEQSERETAMQEVRRVLRHGGILHATESLRSPDIVYDAVGIVHSTLGVATRHSTRAELDALFNGFRELRAEEVPFASIAGRESLALQFFGERR